MNHGSAYSPFFLRSVAAREDVRQRTTGLSSTQYFGFSAPAHLGEICPRNMVLGTASTLAFAVGTQEISGKRFLMRSAKTKTLRISRSTVLTFGRTNMQPEQGGARKTSPWAQSGRFYYQDSCHSRCAWQPARTTFDRRRGSRYCSGAGAVVKFQRLQGLGG